MTNVTRADNCGAGGGTTLHAGWPLGREPDMEYLAIAWPTSVNRRGAQIEHSHRSGWFI